MAAQGMQSSATDGWWMSIMIAAPLRGGGGQILCSMCTSVTMLELMGDLSKMSSRLEDIAERVREQGITSLKQWRMDDPKSHAEANYYGLIQEVEKLCALQRYKKTPVTIDEIAVREWLSFSRPKHTAAWRAGKKSHTQWARNNGKYDELCEEFGIVRIASGQRVSNRRCKYTPDYLRSVITLHNMTSVGDLRKFNDSLYQRVLARPELRNVCEELGIRFKTCRRNRNAIETSNLSSIDFGLAD
jgi:hypothetical protein